MTLHNFRGAIRHGKIVRHELDVLLASEFPIAKVKIINHDDFYHGFIVSPDRHELMKYAYLSDKENEITKVYLYTLLPKSCKELAHFEKLGFIFQENAEYLNIKNLEVITELGT